MPDLRSKRAELVLQQLDELPTLPAVAVRVLQVTREENSSASDVVRLIESDPSLTTRILKLVNRADLGTREVSSVDRAVKLLGFESVRSAVLAVSVFDTFRTAPDGKASRFSREEFWKHCLAVACCAELLALELNKVNRRAAGVDPSDAFVCGLLHDLGKVALDAALPKSFSRVVEASDLVRGDIADVERQVIGIDHMIVGKRLAEKWNLPTNLREVIWLHGNAPSALPGTVLNAKLVNLVTLADALVREQHIGWSGNFSFLAGQTELKQAVGISSEQASAALANLVAAIEPRAAALGLGQSSANELYASAMAQVNAELGRVSQQLTTKSRKLAVRAAFFDALSRFQSELRPDAPPQEIMQAIGQTAGTVIHAGAVAVFSLPPGRTYAETVLLDGAGELVENGIVELVGSRQSAVGSEETLGSGQWGQENASLLQPADRRLPTSLIQPADADLEWLMESISPRLTGDDRYWISLVSEGQCIGGVVFGGAAGEIDRLAPQLTELQALSAGWTMALRTAQIREETRTLAEQLADANRRLQSAEQEVTRNKMLLMVAEMAAGAAHEMNNPLMVISGRSKLLEQELIDPKQKSAAGKIFDNSQRLSGIITELMDFAKPAHPAPSEVPVNTLLDNALARAQTVEPPADRTIVATPGETPAVTVDENQVSAALAEIIVNAMQACDAKSGRIDVSSAFDPFSMQVVLTVSDNGCGMNDGVMKHAFDPFFSSKKAGRRRGMGLSKALRWIEASGGSMRLESRPGLGTRAIVLLPISKSSAQNAQTLRQVELA